MVKVAKCVTLNKVNFTCYLLGLVISEIDIGNIVLRWLSFFICLSSVLVYALVCLVPCIFIVSSIDGVELFYISMKVV